MSRARSLAEHTAAVAARVDADFAAQGITTTVNGVPMSMSRAALKIVSGMKPARTEGQADVEDVTGPGDNGPTIQAQGGIATDRLRSIVERVERLEEEKKALASDIKDIFAEAKSAGFDTQVIKRIIKERKMEPADVEEQETLLDIYRRALGM